MYNLGKHKKAHTMTKDEMIQTLLNKFTDEDVFDIPSLVNATYEEVKDLFEMFVEDEDQWVVSEEETA